MCVCGQILSRRDPRNISTRLLLSVDGLPLLADSQERRDSSVDI